MSCPGPDRNLLSTKYMFIRNATVNGASASKYFYRPINSRKMKTTVQLSNVDMFSYNLLMMQGSSACLLF